MKHLNLLRTGSLLAFVLCGVLGLHAQLAISPNSAVVPNTKAMLELSDVRGFLIPRVTNAQRPPAATNANSLLIYQTDSVGTEPVGFYYWDATLAIANKWVHVGWGNSWKLGGNAGTNPATDFLGTTTAAPLRINTNGAQRMNIAVPPGSQVQIGTLAPATERLEVNGAVRITGTSAAVPTAGAIRFNAATGAHEGYTDNVLAGANEISYPAGWYQLENVFKTRVKQRYTSAPAASCQYPTPVVVPAGATPGSWPLIDGPAANFGTAATLETPYSLFWEDGRHQYLYTAADLQALNICPNTPIKGLAFNTTTAGSGLGMRNIRIKMKNTTAAALTDFDNAGLTTVYSYGNYDATPALVTVSGWNSHVFNVGGPNFYQWLGPGINMLVEYCFDNQDWTTNTPVTFEATAYNSMVGLYCDACGQPGGGSTCYYTGPCNGVGTGSLPPSGVSQVTPGVICTGWGWGGASGGGCAWTTATSLTTCDGTFQYQGAWTIAARRPILKIDAQSSGVFTTYPNSSYILAQKGVMIGNYAAWANSALYAPPNYAFKGPGTISARSSVWGGTVLLSDHVFDMYYDGKTKPEDAKQAAGYRQYNIAEMANYVERERHLPTIDGRDSWRAEGGLFSADKLTNQLWVTVEEQSLYIKELNDRMNALQEYLIEKRLKELKKK